MLDVDALINRTLKRYRQLRKWARRVGVTCYRIYDRDIPAVPVAIDLYEFLPDGIADPVSAASFIAKRNDRVSKNDAHVMEEIRARQYLVINIFDSKGNKVSLPSISTSISQCLPYISSALGISFSHVIVKKRERGKGGGRYSSLNNGTQQSIIGTVYENTLLYEVDLSRRIDTGLFLDHRLLRSIVMKESRGISVLNLYCYTASFSMATAKGMAKHVVSVDLSNTYLAWAKRNMTLNNFDNNTFVFIKSDVIRFLDNERRRGAQYGMIILDPPTFSSSGSAPMMDLNRDYPKLLKLCTQLLTSSGVLYFSTNSRTLHVSGEHLPKGWKAEDIIHETISPDFPLHKAHHTWRITSTEIQLL